jgi:hypothetical protein
MAGGSRPRGALLRGLVLRTMGDTLDVAERLRRFDRPTGCFADLPEQRRRKAVLSFANPLGCCRDARHRDSKASRRARPYMTDGLYDP